MIPRLHLVTDDGVLSRGEFLEKALGVLERGREGIALHLRGPGLEGRRIFEMAEALRGPALDAGALLLVNDRVDVALALDLPGSHLGQRSLPPKIARRLLGPGRVLGVSVHGVEEALEGEDGGADFLLVGTLFPTPSHPQGVPGGSIRMEEVAGATELPLLGIGGVTPDRVREILEAGGHGVAVRGAVWETPEPAAAVDRFQEALGKGRVWMTDSKAITVSINGKEREIPPDLSVTGLLEHLDLNPALVVVELNREILDRSRYEEARVTGGDTLELVHFVGGG